MSRSREQVAARLSGLLLVALFVGWSAAGGAAPKSDDKVKVAVKAEPASGDKSETVSIVLTVERGWHIYANPVGLDDLVPAQTLVTIDAKPKPENVKIEYPAGKLVKDAALGDHRVYEDQVTIKAQVRRSPESGPLTVAVKFSACNDSMCLQGATVKAVVP